MEITIDVLLSFLSNYLLAATTCFIGCFVNEAYSAVKSKAKINIIRILLSSILGAFMACCIYRFLTSHQNKTIELEIFMAICFAIGFWSGKILDILTNKTIIIKALQVIISKFLGEPGKAFVEAWKEADKETKEKEEKKKKQKEDEESKEEKKESSKEKKVESKIEESSDEELVEEETDTRPKEEDDSEEVEEETDTQEREEQKKKKSNSKSSSKRKKKIVAKG